MTEVATAPARPPIIAVNERAALVRMCAAGFLAYCSYAICRTPLLPLFARQLGADAPTVGFVVGASTLAGIILKLPAGAWSDVLGRRTLLVAGAIVFAVMPFTYVGVSTLGFLIALRFVHGSATALFGPVASASLSEVAPVARRATWLSTYSTVQGAGQALGPVVAGYLIAGGGFGQAFVLAGVVALAVPFVVARWPGRTPALSREDGWRRIKTGIGEVARHRAILVTSLAQAAQFVLNGALNAFLPLYGLEIVGLGPAHLGWLFGLQTVATLAARPAAGALSDRVGRPAMISTGLVVCAGAVVLVSLAPDVTLLFGAVAVYAAGVAVTTSATGAFVTDLAKQAHYGAAHGLFGTIYDVGDALGPIAAGLLVAAVGYARMFQTLAGVALVVTVVFWLLVGRSRAG